MSFTLALIPALLTCAGVILFFVRVWFAPIISIVGGASAAVLLGIGAVLNMSEGADELLVAWQAIVLFGGYAVLVIMLSVLPPVLRSVRRVPRARPY